MNLLQLEILTPDRVAFEGDVASVYLQGESGRLGILPAHTPLISTLSFGVLRCDQEGREREVLCGQGFVEVSDNRVSVLVQSAESKDEVDVDRAKRSLERARARINSKEREIDVDRAVRAEIRSMQRLRFVQAL